MDFLDTYNASILFECGKIDSHMGNIVNHILSNLQWEKRTVTIPIGRPGRTRQKIHTVNMANTQTNIYA